MTKYKLSKNILFGGFLSKFKIINEFSKFINKNRKRQLGILVILMIFSALVEMGAIIAIIPFIGILAGGTSLNYGIGFGVLQSYLGIDNSLLTLFITGQLCLLSVLGAGLRLLLIKKSTAVSFGIGSDISNLIYRKTLYQSYENLISKSSSEIIDGVMIKANDIIYGLLLPTLNFITSIVMLSIILSGLTILNPVIVVCTFICFGLIYLVITAVTKKSIDKNSMDIAKSSPLMIKCIQEGLGGIRDILIDRTQEVYCSRFQVFDSILRKAQGSNLFIASSPRYLVETLGVIFISILTLYTSQLSEKDNIAYVLPILGVMVVSSQKILPLMQQIYNSWINFGSNQASVCKAIDFLKSPTMIKADNFKMSDIDFTESIALRNLSYKYPTSEILVIQDLNLTIKKGVKVGIIGKTGSGKSTLVDILMGLLHPTSGEVRIDKTVLTGSNTYLWQKHIAHVPQSIYLSDSSIMENIAFGIAKDDIDIMRVHECAKLAFISDYVETLKDGYYSTVGERGIQLSGGQKQRIGIARALYKKADVIIFDEATSALDEITELQVMQSINSLNPDLTMFIIAHRISTLNACDYIIDMNNIK